MAIHFRPELLNDICTHFVRDRLAETNFEDRDYIAALATFEWNAVNGPRSWGGSLLYAYTKNSYPVEAACIEREMREGIYTPPEEFARLLREAGEATAAADEAGTARRQADDERVRQAWFAAGGRP